VFEASSVFAVLSRALDDAALRQAAHTSNIANASVEGFRRLDVSFDAQLRAIADGSLDASADSTWSAGQPRLVATDESVRLDHEMALMAKDAVRYQALLGAFERTTGLLSLAIHEGREG
jgi:flagellar basal-body rod protein FlgB